MNEIRTTKIDWVEFVTYKDYLRLKEENKAVWIVIDEVRRINEKIREENKKLKSDLEQFSEAYKRYRDYEKEELAESCYDLERENKKQKDRIAELEKCNLNLQEQIDKITKDRDERKRKEECSNVIIDFVKQQAREKWWTI